MTIVQRKERHELAAKFEDIRLTSRSIHEVIERLLSLWLSIGIKVTFTSYPSSFNDKVSNTHNAPEGYPQNWGSEADKPKGYPGWRGLWQGTVEVVDNTVTKKSKLYFSDLIGSWDVGLPRLPWIKTGSGGGGENFRFEGILFIYDFPKMYEEFEANGGQFGVLQKEYCKTVDQYRREFNNKRSHYISNTEEHMACTSMLKDLDEVMKKVRTLQKQTTDYYRAKFTADYDVSLPRPTSIFVDDQLLEATTTLVNYNKSIPLPELESTEKYIRQLSAQIDDYKESHPEVFI